MYWYKSSEGLPQEVLDDFGVDSITPTPSFLADLVASEISYNPAVSLEAFLDSLKERDARLYDEMKFIFYRIRFMEGRINHLRVVSEDLG